MGQFTARAAIRTFWARDGAAYDAATGHAVGSQQERDRWRALLTDAPAGSQILDAGSGTGFVALIAAALGHEVVAVDQSADMLAHARHKAEEAGLEVRVEVADIERLAADDATIDVVTARHVLWTLLDPLVALTEWRRVLRPSGVLLADLSLGARAAHYDDDVEASLPLQRVDDPRVVTDLLGQAGFTVVEVRDVAAHGHRPPGAVLVSRP